MFCSCFLKILILLVLKVEFHGMDGNGGAPYIGSCCFHRRDTLCGRKFNKQCTSKWYKENDLESLHELEAKSKVLASCTYEENTQWGKEVGFFLNFTWSKYQIPDNSRSLSNTICMSWHSCLIADRFEIRVSSQRCDYRAINSMQGMEIGVFQSGKESIRRFGANHTASNARAAQEMVRREFSDFALQVQPSLVCTWKD